MARTFGPCGEIVVEGSGSIQLAPDLTWPTNRLDANDSVRELTGIDVSGNTLQTLLTLTGAFNIQYVRVSDIASNENVQMRLTVDGVVIYDTGTYTPGTATRDLIFGSGPTDPDYLESFVCRESFLLEYATDTDTSITLGYKIKPII